MNIAWKRKITQNIILNSLDMEEFVSHIRNWIKIRRADAESVITALRGKPWIVQFLVFLVIRFERIALSVALFLAMLPVHLKMSPQESFQRFAGRSENGEFLESYTGLIRQHRYAVLTTVMMLVGAGIGISTLGFGLYKVGNPTLVSAYSTNVTINPTWDQMAEHDVTQNDDFMGGCDNMDDYICGGPSANAMNIGRTGTFRTNCTNILDSYVYYYRAGLKFSLASVPDNATVTNVELLVTVQGATSQSVSIIHPSNDNPNTLDCVTSPMFDALGTGTTYASGQNWSTTGTKTVDLGATADSDVQSRLTTSDVIALGIKTVESASSTGAIYSNEWGTASQRPQLRVTYTLPAEAPTSSNHSANTTSTVTWSWTDNATVDTANYIHDAAHAVKCTAGAVSGTGSTGTCQETGLSANTQYTRHPNAVDADGNSDGSSASAYTSIETPTGISFGSVTATSMTASATGSISNLLIGSSGLYFQESVTSTNSGWTQTNSWPKSGLTANTQYSFQAKARNGDGDETSLTSAATQYTLSSAPNVSSTRSASTWYNVNPFPFTNGAAWGAGGVQYYRYVFDQSAAHIFTGSESTWSSVNANCPGGTCADAGTTLNKTATGNGNNWYLHVQPFNASDVANGSGTDYGPYYFDGTNPTTPATVNDGTAADAAYQTSLTAVSGNWSASTDADSGVQKYQYAIGTTSGGTEVQTWTDNGTSTSVTKTGLSLANGTTYYVSARAVDNAGNTGSLMSSNGITANSSLPGITDGQTGDATPRKSAGAAYDVDFAKAPTGPNLDYAQYAVYSGPGKTGTLLKDWTNIFTTDTASFTTDWTVDFTALAEGTNYVSVKAVALDGLSSETDDIFTILKDTLSPAVTSFTADPAAASVTLLWTTNEPATSQVRYGTTTSYGSTTELDSTLSTSHSVSVTGLAANTTFHAQALSTDAAGNATSSADLSFTTTSLPHTLITNVKVTVLSPTSVTVTWTTNEPATSKVRYGATTDYGLEASDATLVTSHSITLTDLTPGTQYHYEVISVGSSTDHDADATFSTSAGTLTTLSDVRVIAGETIATFIWTTNEPATSAVNYGTTTDYGFVKSDTEKVTSHRVQVNDLTPGTTYHYTVASTGSTEIISKDFSFTTATPEATSNRAIGPTVLDTVVRDGPLPSIVLKGVAKGNQTIRIYVDDRLVRTFKVSGTSKETKTFAVSVSLKDLPTGSHTMYAKSTDENGRTSRIRQRLTFTLTTRDHAKTPIAIKGSTARYEVAPGDSLWKIAEQFLGSGARYPEIVARNARSFPALAADPKLIHPGQLLIIPRGSR